MTNPVTILERQAQADQIRLAMCSIWRDVATHADPLNREIGLDEATGWIATDLDINCDTEPDIDGPEWEGWWADHSHDFCHRWHDLHEQLVATLKFTHRVLHDNGPRD